MLEISVVSPVYGCADCLRQLHARLTEVLNDLVSSYEIVLVDDRSPDGAWTTMQQLAAEDDHVRTYRLSRNFGQHAAITAGLAHARGRFVVVMDCDLQDPPEHIPQLYEKALEGHEVVLSRRHRRVGSLSRRATGQAYYRLHNVLSGTDIYTNYTNFSMLSRRAVDAFLTLGEKDRQYLLIVNWIGFSRAEIVVPAGARASGKSSYTWLSLLRVAADGIFFSTTRLLRWIVYLGFLLAMVGGALAIYTVIKYAAGGHVSSFAGVSVLVLLASGFIIFSTGVTALYVGKIFDQVKARPLYLVDASSDPLATPAREMGAPQKDTTLPTGD